MRGVAAALLVVVADALVLVLGAGWPPGWVVAGQLAGIPVMAALSSRPPLAAFLGALVLAVPGGGNALLMWTGYGAGCRVASSRGLAVAGGGVLACGGGQLLLTAHPPGPLVTGYVAFAVLPLLLGRYRAQHRSARTARRRHEHRERALLAGQERLRERLRIARHDTLGHGLSLICVQAAALEVTHLPQPQADAVRRLADTARRAVDELHELVGTLRERSAPAARSLAAIDALAAEFRAAGTPVTVTRDGGQALGPVAEHAAYRVVEEGLTNAAKHAPGRPVTVSVREEGDALLVSVRNPVAGSGAGRVGHGLAGLEERVRLAGGAFHAAREAGEFRVAAMLPLVAATTEDRAEDGAGDRAEDGAGDRAGDGAGDRAGDGAGVPGPARRLWPVALAVTAVALSVLAGPVGPPGG